MRLFIETAMILFLSVVVGVTGLSDTTYAEALGKLSAEPSYRVVLRSLVYPGWGQLHNGKYLKALSIFASETALLAMIYHESKESSRAYEAHLAAPDRTVAAKFYARYEEHFERRESLIWWTAGLIAFSLADAYVDANLVTFEEEFGEPEENTRISLNARSSPRGGFVCLEYSF